jgi:dCMP deaminase
MPRKTIYKWDKRFLDLAKLVSTWSKDPSTKTGAVLVSPDRKQVILGYNGYPSVLLDTGYEDRNEKLEKIIHCEMNAILIAKRDLTSYTLYTYPFLSCNRCAVHVIQSGIMRVVTYKSNNVRWKDSFSKSRKYFKEAGVLVDEY